MLFWIIQNIVLSTIFIFLVHYLINFFKSTLTVPKIKDLVNSTNKKYENIYNVLENSKENSKEKCKENSNLNIYLPQNVNEKMNDDDNYMKDELKNFLKQQFL